MLDTFDAAMGQPPAEPSHDLAHAMMRTFFEIATSGETDLSCAIVAGNAAVDQLEAAARAEHGPTADAIIHDAYLQLAELRPFLERAAEA